MPRRREIPSARSTAGPQVPERRCRQVRQSIDAGGEEVRLPRASFYGALTSIIKKKTDEGFRSKCSPMP
jgi:hypothetical protein